MAKYDLIIIGSGPGGYVCAIKAGQLGLKVACVESRAKLGGTCLNVGCIPSKALLHAAHQVHEANTNFSTLGIDIAKINVNWTQMLKYKQSTIDANTSGVEYLFKKNKVDWLQGAGEIVETGKVKVGTKVYETKNIVIATGSVPSELKGIDVDEKSIVTSTGALELKALPKSLAIIGAGVIGLELGSVYAWLGTKVTVLEYLDRIIPGMDLDVAKTFEKILKKQGLEFKCGVKVVNVKKGRGAQEISYEDSKSDTILKERAEIVLVATGRRPFTEGLGITNVGVKLTPQGQIDTDNKFATNVAGIYAIGDVISGPMLAHKAADEGIAVAETIAGLTGYVNHEIIPSIIYTQPEVAAVGRTEEDLKEAGIDYKVGKFSLKGNARAKSVMQADGFVKILAAQDSDRILGCHIISPAASDLIQEICLAMEFGASAEDVALTSHGHPTYSEAVREAALACGDGPIHA